MEVCDYIRGKDKVTIHSSTEESNKCNARNGGLSSKADFQQRKR
jgi:hypothetical protein